MVFSGGFKDQRQKFSLSSAVFGHQKQGSVQLQDHGPICSLQSGIGYPPEPEPGLT